MLKEFQNKYHCLYNFLSIPIFSLDINGLIVDANEAAAHLFGLQKHCIINHSFSRYVAPDFQGIFSTHYQRTLETNQAQTCEIKLLRRHGPLFYVRLESKIFINENTGQKEVLTTATDITFRKQTEYYVGTMDFKISDSERMNSLSTLASTFSHEINPPIAVIANYLHGCIRRINGGQKNNESLLCALEHAVKQLHRISEIILRMKNFICKRILILEITPVDHLLKEAIYLINCEAIDFPVQIQYRPLKEFSLLNIDKIHIQQVILNLARNAIEAMRDANTLEPQLIIEVNKINRDLLEICVKDNGPGFSDETIHKLFDTHFTSKPYGIGLGLAISRMIVMSHEGELSCELNATQGACFKFTLPIVNTII